MNMNIQHVSHRLAALTVLVSLGFASLFAGNRSGTVSEQFLKIGTSARSIGMGGAQGAVAEGVTSIAYNPAGILTGSDYGFGATYTAWLASIQHSFIGVTKNIPGVGGVGASLTLLTTDDMPVTTVSYPEGTGETFRASDYAFSLCFARQGTEHFRAGVNGKIIQSYLYHRENGTFCFSFSLRNTSLPPH